LKEHDALQQRKMTEQRFLQRLQNTHILRSKSTGIAKG